MNSDNVEITSAIKEIANIATRAAGAPLVEAFAATSKDGHGVVGVLVPKTHELKDLTAAIDKRVEDLALGPRRLISHEKAETLEGFIALTNRHASANTAIEALILPSETSGGTFAPRLRAIVDYHLESDGSKGPEARRCEHTIAYAFPLSARCKRWLAASGEFKSKRDFLRFVQENVADLVCPDEIEAEPGSVTRTEFEGVLRARGKSKAEREAAPLESLFGSPGHLCEGAKRMGAISSEEFEEAEAGLGDVTISFKKADKTTGSESVREFYLVRFAVFEGDAPEVLPMRLRTLVEGGKLHMRLEVIGLQTVIERAFAKACARVASETGRPVYRVKLQ